MQQQRPEVGGQSFAHAGRRAAGLAHQVDDRADRLLVVQSIVGGIQRPALQRRFVQGAPGDQKSLQTVQGLASAVERGLGVHQAGAQAAHQTQGGLGALEIAAEPEQIVGGSAGQVADDPPDLHLVGAGEQGDPLDRRVGDDPDIGGARALTHGDGSDIGPVGGAAESPRHDADAVRRGRGVNSQHERRGLQAAIAQQRRGRQSDDLLTDEVAGPVGEAREEGRALLRR